MIGVMPGQNPSQHTLGDWGNDTCPCKNDLTNLLHKQAYDGGGRQ